MLTCAHSGDVITFKGAKDAVDAARAKGDVLAVKEYEMLFEDFEENIKILRSPAT